MSAQYSQQVKQQLADAKRDYAPGSAEVANAEQAYKNIGGDPNEVAPSDKAAQEATVAALALGAQVFTNGEEVTDPTKVDPVVQDVLKAVVGIANESTTTTTTVGSGDTTPEEPT